jgi:hypothetical protein
MLQLTAVGRALLVAVVDNPFAQNITNYVSTTLKALCEVLRTLKRHHLDVPVALDSVLETPDHEYRQTMAL